MFKSKGTNFEKAKSSRKIPTTADAMLWEYLRGRRFLSLKFTRQCPIHNYIVDFFCYKLNLAIEVDGKYHLEEEQRKEDIIKTKHLNSLDSIVFRLNNEEATVSLMLWKNQDIY